MINNKNKNIIMLLGKLNFKCIGYLKRLLIVKIRNDHYVCKLRKDKEYDNVY